MSTRSSSPRDDPDIPVPRSLWTPVSWYPQEVLTRGRANLIERALTEDFVLRHGQVASNVYLRRKRTVGLQIRYAFSSALSPAHAAWPESSGPAHSGSGPGNPDPDPRYHVTVSGLDENGVRVWTEHIYPRNRFKPLAKRINAAIIEDSKRRTELNVAVKRGRGYGAKRERGAKSTDG